MRSKLLRTASGRCWHRFAREDNNEEDEGGRMRKMEEKDREREEKEEEEEEVTRNMSQTNMYEGRHRRDEGMRGR
eukprot:9446701-Pyramimonas_sp.AAC.1